MNPSPILRISGTVHASNLRDVPAYAGRPEVRDEQGAVTQRRSEPREAYRNVEVVVLTEGGGFAKVLIKEDDLATALGAAMPEPGQKVDWPLRTYVGWAGSDYQRFRVVGFSLAGDVLAGESKEPGRRVSAVS